MRAYHLQLVPLAPHIVQTNLLLHLSARSARIRTSGRGIEGRNPKQVPWDHTFPKVRNVINGVCGLLLYFNKTSTEFRSAKLDAKQLLELVPQKQRQNRLLWVI